MRIVMVGDLHRTITCWSLLSRNHKNITTWIMRCIEHWTGDQPLCCCSTKMYTFMVLIFFKMLMHTLLLLEGQLVSWINYCDVAPENWPDAVASTQFWLLTHGWNWTGHREDCSYSVAPALSLFHRMTEDMSTSLGIVNLKEHLLSCEFPWLSI